MKTSTLLVALTTGLSTSVSATALSFVGCLALSAIAPSRVFYPSSSTYKYENADFWSNTQLLDPACIYRPVSGSDLSLGIKVLTKTLSKFAVRGGGHMGIKVLT